MRILILALVCLCSCTVEAGFATSDISAHQDAGTFDVGLSMDATKADAQTTDVKVQDVQAADAPTPQDSAQDVQQADVHEAGHRGSA